MHAFVLYFYFFQHIYSDQQVNQSLTFLSISSSEA